MSLHEDWLKLKALVEREGQEVDAKFHKLVSEITRREDGKQEAVQAAKDAAVEPVEVEPVVEAPPSE